jgi:hypothetical protein
MQPAEPNDPGFFKVLSFTEQDALIHAKSQYALHFNLSQTLRLSYALGTYEGEAGAWTTVRVGP